MSTGSSNSGGLGFAVSAAAVSAVLGYLIAKRQEKTVTDKASAGSGLHLPSCSEEMFDQSSASPRNAGELAYASAGTSADGATPKLSTTLTTGVAHAEGENPWVISEGERSYTLGDVKRVALKIDELLLLQVPHLADHFPRSHARFANLRQKAVLSALVDSGESIRDYTEPQGFLNFTSDDSVVVGDIVRKTTQKTMSRAYLRAGPREVLYFKPSTVTAAIVTCGGLCPGLNNVIREIVNTLWNSYGVRNILGLQHGYWGFWSPDITLPGASDSKSAPERRPPIKLTPETVASIHNYGGTMLGSDRGGDNPDMAVAFLKHYGVNQVYIIGGDGTHRGAHAIYTKCVEEKLSVVIAGLPKTIDNDVGIIDRSFGFDTAVAEAQTAIKTAKIEASGAPNGIGLVKLMGRYAGFIAAHATLASGDVDLCLIPEVPVVMEGPCSVLAHLERVLARKGHAVVVVAEGAGEELLAAVKTSKGEKIEVDAGGNRKLPPIAPWLKAAIASYFDKRGNPVCLKYIDPSYMIRSVPANPADAIYCTLLAQSAVHGAMAGFTGFSVGLTNNRLVYLPITAITANSPRRLNPRGRTYERVLSLTGQPDPLSDPEIAKRVPTTHGE